MREIVLYPGESVTIGDTVIKAAHGPAQSHFIPTVFPVIPEHAQPQPPSSPINPYDAVAPVKISCATNIRPCVPLVSEIDG